MHVSYIDGVTKAYTNKTYTCRHTTYNTHMHTQYTYANKYFVAYIHTYVVCIHTHIHMHVHAYTRTCTHTYTYIFIPKNTCMQMHVLIHSYMYTHTHTLTHVHKYMHT